jgi:hypothetical protein
MSTRKEIWEARENLLKESAHFMLSFDRKGKTYRDFHDAYKARFGEISWSWKDEPDAPDWVESLLMADAEHLHQFDPGNAGTGVGLDDLMQPDGVRDGYFAEDLQGAKGRLAAFDTLYGDEFEDHAYSILGQLLHYHRDRRDEATIALRDEIARLRRGAPDGSP